MKTGQAYPMAGETTFHSWCEKVQNQRFIDLETAVDHCRSMPNLSSVELFVHQPGKPDTIISGEALERLLGGHGNL